jgi:hypothetical protein
VSRLTIILGVFWLILAIAIFTSQYLLPISIEVNWETESEFDTVGFNVLRSDSATGHFTRLNDNIIPGSADPVVGGSYQFVDSNVEPGIIYYYRLEDVEYDSTISAHEIIEATAETRPWWIAVLALASALVGIAIIAYSVLSQRGKS